MKRRWIVAGVAVVLLGISATGLAVNREWLAGRCDASNAATDLADKLTALDGVKTAAAGYDPLGLPEPTMTVSVTFAANTPAGVWGRATTLMRAAASEHQLRGTTTTTNFREAGSAGTAHVDPAQLSPAAISREIAAWRALKSMVGDEVSLRLSSHGRQYGVGSSAKMRAVAASWPESCSLPASSGTTGWLAPGMQLATMPTATQMAALSSVGDILPLAPVAIDPKLRGTYAVVLGDVQGFKVTILPLGNGGYANAQPDSKVAAAVSAALTSGAPAVEWISKGHDATMVVGECRSYQNAGRTIATTLTTSADDTWFADQLAADGFTMPAGVHAGACRP